tara:strand:+ start:51 stop:638 length:588 start_codon:yes stop_codon:yes gene_type:complete
MAQTVTIVKSGSGIQILGYSANGAASISDVTIFNPNGVKVFLNGNIITMQFEGYPPLTFTQIEGGFNAIGEINGTVTDFENDASAVVSTLKYVFRTGFGGQVGVVATSATITQVQTSGTGANFVNFDDIPCDSLDITNNTGVDIEYNRDGGGYAMPIIDKQSRLIPGITNANQIYVRRIDQIGSAVIVPAEAIKA